MGSLKTFVERISEKEIKRGDIFNAELNPIIGSEQGGTTSGGYYFK